MSCSSVNRVVLIEAGGLTLLFRGLLLEEIRFLQDTFRGNFKVSRGRKHGVFIEPLLLHEQNCELVTIYLPSDDSRNL